MSDTLAYRPLFGARLNMAHPLARGMVGCWLLNENGGVRAMDLSPSSAHGALTGFGSPPRRGFNGLQFTAATPSYIEIPASYTQLNFTSEDFSIIARIRIEGLATRNTIFSRGSLSVDGCSFIVTETRRVDFYTWNGAQQRTYGTASVPLDAWCTVGVSRSGADAYLYLNGADTVEVSGTHINPLTSARTAKIGIEDDLSTNPFDGKIEFLYIWGKRKLIVSEHQAVHASPYNPMGIPLFV